MIRGRRTAVSTVAGLLVLIACVFAGPLARPAGAHPLGNFTTNTSAALLPSTDAVWLRYVVDLAEVPTQQAQRAITQAGSPEAWAQDECARAIAAQQLDIDGTPQPLQLDQVAISFPEGEAGLDTTRLRCDAVAELGDAEGQRTLGLTDGYQPDRAGWREIVAVGDGVGLADSDVPDVSASDQLRRYPSGEVSDVTMATVVIDPEQPVAVGSQEKLDALTATEVDAVEASVSEASADDGAGGWLEGLVEAYTDLIARQDLTVGFVLLAFVLAIGLGTAHAVAPGHGKTVIAAYMLGEGGQVRQAVALGATVAVTHTIGVLVLGVIVQTSATLAPERLYPLLGAFGGALFVVLGVILLRRAVSNRGHSHAHEHGHSHDHAPSHGHGHSHEHGSPPAPTGWRSLILPGLAGGMVPSPSALLVLLGGVAIGRAWFGVLLVLAYGVGMALALVGAGYLLHRVRSRIMERLESDRWARISGALPVATSSLIVAGGLVIVLRSLVFA